MPTDTIRSRTRALDFMLRAAAWSLGLFGLLRLDWVETHAVLPLTRLQGWLAVHGVGGIALRRALLAVLLGFVFVRLLGAPCTRLVAWAVQMLGGVAPSSVATSTPLDDPQGATAALPAFQVGLYVALWAAAFVAAGWKRFLAGLALLELTQIAALLTLHVLASHFGFTPHVRDIRAWAMVGPLLVVAAVVNVDRLLRRPTSVARPVGDGARG